MGLLLICKIMEICLQFGLIRNQFYFINSRCMMLMLMLMLLLFVALLGSFPALLQIGKLVK